MSRSQNGVNKLLTELSVDPIYINDCLLFLDSIESPYLKVDLQEILDMDDTSLDSLVFALSYFDNPKKTSWEIVFLICDIDSVTRRLNLEESRFPPPLNELLAGLVAVD